jgi:hypothetical protein
LRPRVDRLVKASAQLDARRRLPVLQKTIGRLGIALEKPVEVLVALTQQSLAVLEIQPPLDPQARLIEISPDRGMRRTAGVEALRGGDHFIRDDIEKLLPPSPDGVRIR